MPDEDIKPQQLEIGDLPIQPVDSLSPVPLYHQINLDLRRMIAERKQIAEKFRSEGKGEAQKILGEKERDLKQIQSEAYKTAQIVKGKADAEATTIYAQSYGADPEFYSFTQTLDIYKEALDNTNTLVLSTDSEFLKYLKGYSK